MTVGGRNLVILGVAATVIAVAATSVSLMVYHNSGDIYLDRSRPGFLPGEEEIEEEVQEESFEFAKDGIVTEVVLDEYLQALENELRGLDAYQGPFSEAALSGEALGF